MIKLKDLLKESHAWERKFGEKLPTLASVQKKKLKEDNYSYVDCLKKNIDLRIDVQKRLDAKNDENEKFVKIDDFL